jgi:hypothetical protein
MREMIN